MKGKITLLIITIFTIQAVILGAVLLVSNKQTTVALTPIPTLQLATMPAASFEVGAPPFGRGECQIAALDLIGSWVAAGKPEGEPFQFTGIAGNTCNGSFDSEIFPIFNEANVWYPGAIACSACHGEIGSSPAQLNLSTYTDILAGSRRSSPSAPGQDIFGNPESWETSKLYIQIFTRQMPFGAPAGTPQRGPVIRAGAEK